MSERDARGPEEHDKPSFILGGSAWSPVENWIVISSASVAMMPSPAVT